MSGLGKRFLTVINKMSGAECIFDQSLCLSSQPAAKLIKV